MLCAAYDDDLCELIHLQSCIGRLEKLTEKKKYKRKRFSRAEENLFAAIDSAVHAIGALFDSEKSFGGFQCPSDWEKIRERREEIESIFNRAIESLIQAAKARLKWKSIPACSFTLISDQIRTWIRTLNLRIVIPRCSQYMLLKMG